MSDVLTHKYCADDALKMVYTSELKSILETHYDIYILGSQGPDILFYYNALPWQDDDGGVNELGNMIHDNKVFEFYKYSFDYIKSLDNKYHKDVLTSYMMGFLSHYALDRATHPYIYYMTGVLVIK